VLNESNRISKIVHHGESEDGTSIDGAGRPNPKAWRSRNHGYFSAGEKDCANNGDDPAEAEQGPRHTKLVLPCQSRRFNYYIHSAAPVNSIDEQPSTVPSIAALLHFPGKQHCNTTSHHIEE
jgi:hypothetical protein